jgi:hypothetical protein
MAIATVCSLIYLEWLFIPRKYYVYREPFFLLSPTIMVCLVLCGQFLERIGNYLRSGSWQSALKYLFVMAASIYLGLLYFQFGSSHADQVNTAYSPHDDEESFMAFAKDVRLSDFRDTGSRNQMPVYPTILALFYKPELIVDAFFDIGKQVNIVLSLLSLPILFFIFYRFLPLHESVNLILMTAFGLYVFKSGYILVELLYYTLAAIGFILMVSIFIRPSIHLGVLTGLILGITHLTKASVLPAILLLVFTYLLKEVFITWHSSKRNHTRLDRNRSGKKTRINSVLMVVIVYLVTIAPYLIESKVHYGRFFYNVNSTFYMWYDSWEEAIEGTIAHGDQKGWPDMPPEEIPGPGKYIREHSLSDILARLKYGTNWQLQNIRYQYSFFNYPVFFLIIAIILILLRLKRSISFARSDLWLIIFIIGYITGYLLLFIWYSPIANSPRFIYSLFIPFLFSISVMMRRLADDISTPLIKLTNITILVMIIIDIWYITSQGPLFRDYGM